MRGKERSETLTYKLEPRTSEIQGFPSGQLHQRSHKFHFVGERERELFVGRKRDRESCRGKRRGELQRRE